MRKYKRKRPRQWRNKDKRMAAAVRLRAEGKSNRQIGKELAVDERTVRRDLERWQQEHSNVVPLVRQSDAASCPAGGNLPHPDAAPIASLADRRK